MFLIGEFCSYIRLTKVSSVKIEKCFQYFIRKVTRKIKIIEKKPCISFKNSQIKTIKNVWDNVRWLSCKFHLHLRTYILIMTLLCSYFRVKIIVRCFGPLSFNKNLLNKPKILLNKFLVRKTGLQMDARSLHPFQHYLLYFIRFCHLSRNWSLITSNQLRCLLLLNFRSTNHTPFTNLIKMRQSF